MLCCGPQNRNPFSGPASLAAQQPGPLDARRIKMKSKPNETEEITTSILLGIISLAVGGLFFCPGIYFFSKVVGRLISGSSFPGIGIIAFIGVLLLIGSILISLSIKAFTGKLGEQKVSPYVLTFASIFFLSISAMFFCMTYIFEPLPHSYNSGRAIGGSFAIGAIGIYTVYKKRKASSTYQAPGRQE